MSQNENTTVENEKEGKRAQIIYLSDIIKGLMKFWWLAVIFVVIGGIISTVVERKNYVPEYTCSETLTVETASSSTSGIAVYSFYYDASTATQLAETFPHILSSNLLQNAICEKLGIDSIGGTLSASSVSGTNLFTITFTGTDPQQTYDVLVTAIEKYPVVAQFVVGDLKFTTITEPQVPESPDNSFSYVEAFMTGALIGLLLGVALILGYALMRDTVRSRSEIKKKLTTETIGVIPQVTFKKHNMEVDESVLVTNDRIGNGFLESMRVFKNTFVNALDEGEKIVLFTSTAPGEGKSTVCGNLALSLARSGSKVLVVDADMRNPSIKPLLNLNEEELHYHINTEWYKICYLKQFNLSLMTLAEENKKYWKMMKTGFFSQIFDEIKVHYDYILVDTPPCGLVSDALSIAQSCDAVLYVVLQDTIRTSKIRAGIESLMSTDTKVMGCVLNGALSGHVGYGSDYGYGYYGKYGYGKYGYGKYGYGRYGYGYGGYGYGYGDSDDSDDSE